MSETSGPVVIGAGSGDFVKARELVGEQFTVNSVREGISNYGPSYYLDIAHGGDSQVLGALVKSPIGQQCAKFGMTTFSGRVLTIVRKESKRFKDENGNPKPVYLLAFFEAPEDTPSVLDTTDVDA